MRVYKFSWRFCLTALSVWALFAPRADALPTVELGTYNFINPTATTGAMAGTGGTYDLLPNTPGQVIKIYAHGGDAVEGVDLVVQIGDGGANHAGTGTGPVITAVNIEPTATSIFNSTNAGHVTSGPTVVGNPSATVSQLWEASDTVGSGHTNVGSDDTVVGHGLLAYVTIDTTGFFAGSGPFPLVLTGTVDGSTDFASIAANAPSGNLNILPEPSSFAMMLIGASALLLRKRKPVAMIS